MLVRRVVLVPSLTMLLLTACSSGSGNVSPDASDVDDAGASLDGTTADSSTADAAPRDGASVDAAGSDATIADGGAGDGDSSEDASTADAGADVDTDAFDAAATADSGTDAEEDSGPSCTEATTAARWVSLDVYAMLDRSTTMGEAVASGGTKWSKVKDGFASFVASASNVSVGVQVVGIPKRDCRVKYCTQNSDCTVVPLCQGGQCISGEYVCTDVASCTVSDYATPRVAIDALPAHASALSDSIAAIDPFGDGALGPALQGTVDHAKSVATANADHDVVALVVTDGRVSRCGPSDEAGISAIATAARTGTPSIKTFVVNVRGTNDPTSGASMAEAVAVAGGTSHAIAVDTAAPSGATVVDALRSVVASAGCKVHLPTVDGGAAPTDQTNLRFTSTGGTPTTIPHVADAASCPSSGDAWFYDDATHPTRMVLCASTCAAVRSDPTGELVTTVGCPTSTLR